MPRNRVASVRIASESVNNYHRLSQIIKPIARKPYCQKLEINNGLSIQSAMFEPVFFIDSKQ